MSPNIVTAVDDIPLGWLYDVIMKPFVPLLGVALYLTMVSSWERKNRQRAATATPEQLQDVGKGSVLKWVVIVHNLVLAAYSLWTFIDYFPAVVQNVRDHGLKDGFCDSQWTLWNRKLLAHGFLFYLSKYYEFIDTAIILAKGRPAGRLQTFHHSGAVLIMWFGNYVQSPYLSFFVFENSIIHSLMYTYYTLTALGFRPPGKKILTSMQISQFYIALSAGIIYAVLPGCQDKWQRVFTYVFVAYIVELIRLFTDFARRTYGPRNGADRKKTQ
ncbi:hypothetical protein J3B02_000551 [Coemansia erecta]|uniref:Elongation of fatty acids protein n=1 Tax=Coemansia asiatica TaxID=1052880 RepID=A0A9W8CMJ0_9FUNG|nr:hypothetical protein LPJ64_000988 [Coemansia asiatica]KAJ2858061.1 hypothetical protein J3B02_000551 [Coemansia erecta]